MKLCEQHDNREGLTPRESSVKRVFLIKLTNKALVTFIKPLLIKNNQ